MTYFADLSPYTYFESSVPMVNIGWLDPPHSFPVGEAPERFADALWLLGDEPENVARGFHVCGYCQSGFDQNFLGTGEIHAVGADGVRYAAPRLVAHYVAHHGYLPPRVFVDAVLKRAREIWTETDRLFDAAGWTPGRSVDTSAWRGMFRGLAWHDAADAFLGEFGGLSYHGLSVVDLDPQRCAGVADRFAEWGRTYRGVVPIGVMDEFFLGVDRTGEVRGCSDWLTTRLGTGRHAIYKLSRGIERFE